MRFVQVIRFDSTESDDVVTKRLNNEFMRINKDGGKIINVVYRDTAVNGEVKYCVVIEYEA